MLENTATPPLTPEPTLIPTDASLKKHLHVKKISFRALLSILTIFILVVGAAAAFYLTGRSAEIRQQASSAYQECNGVPDRGKACAGFREVVECHNGLFAPLKTCAPSERCDKDAPSGCTTLPPQDCNGTPNTKTACDTLHSFVVCNNGYFSTPQACNPDQTCVSGACIGGASPKPSPRPSPVPSPSPSLRTSPQPSPIASPRVSPRPTPSPIPSPSPSLRTSPQPSPIASPRVSPRPTPSPIPSPSPSSTPAPTATCWQAMPNACVQIPVALCNGSNFPSLVSCVIYRLANRNSSPLSPIPSPSVAPRAVASVAPSLSPSPSPTQSVACWQFNNNNECTPYFPGSGVCAAGEFSGLSACLSYKDALFAANPPPPMACWSLTNNTCSPFTSNTGGCPMGNFLTLGSCFIYRDRQSSAEGLDGSTMQPSF